LAQRRDLDSVLTVACVYERNRTAGFFDEYVYRLKAGFAKHCKVPHRFVCLTNAALPGVEAIPLVNKWPGWWSKLELFYLQGPVVYCDLDTMILDDITDICALRGPNKFSVLMGLGAKPTSIGAGERDFASAFMAWDQDLSHIPAAFSLDRIHEYSTRVKWGDQSFIQDHLARPADKLQDLFPGRFVHYKTHCRGPDKSPLPAPPGASVVLFSGKPRPADINWTLPAS
jgi:hypothetical protein